MLNRKLKRQIKELESENDQLKEYFEAFNIELPKPSGDNVYWAILMRVIEEIRKQPYHESHVDILKLIINEMRIVQL